MSSANGAQRTIGCFSQQFLANDNKAANDNNNGTKNIADNSIIRLSKLYSSYSRSQQLYPTTHKGQRLLSMARQI